MTKEELAALLNGRQMGSGFTKEEQAQAKKDELIVIYGASDDLIRFGGAINDETEGPGIVHMDYGRILPPHRGCLCEYCGYEKAKNGTINIVAAFSDQQHSDYSWWIEPDANAFSFVDNEPIQFAAFDIMKGDEKFCRGVVLDRNEIYEF